MQHHSPRSTRAPGGTPRVLFVSHEASRTGAPMMFLNFLRWVREHTSLDFEILLLNGGPLTDDFAAVAPMHLVEALGRGSASYVEAGIARAGFPELSDRVKVARARRAVRDLRGFDALYLNSTTSALALRILPEVPPLVFSHIHELDSAFTYWFPERERQAMLACTDRFITCAEAVTRHLVDDRGVPADRVSCHYEFVQPPKPHRERSAELRASLGIGPDAVVVGGSGMVIWRKGPDLFLQAAATVARRRPDLDVHFVWVGGDDTRERIPVAHDIARLGLEGRVHFVGEVANPADLFATFDVFCLTSREDPYPLVMLETAALGVPVVSFANGGAVEFAGDHDDPLSRRAFILPYLDVEGMADVLVDLAEHPGVRKLIGHRGRQRVLEEHTVEVGAAALFREVMDQIGGDGTAFRERAVPPPRPDGNGATPSGTDGGPPRRQNLDLADPFRPASTSGPDGDEESACLSR